MLRRLDYRPPDGMIFCLTLVVMLLACSSEPELVPDEMAGDVAESIQGMDPDDMWVHAQAFLASDRPWRAAQVMRRYADLVPNMPPDHRVLAARAEAGWEAWPAVLRLLRDMPALDTYDNGIGLYLLGRALDDTGDAAGAVAAYRSFLALSPPAGELENERRAARLRLGLALVRAGDRGAARRELQIAGGIAGGATVWINLLEAGALAEIGDTAAVRQLVAGLDEGLAGLRGRRIRIHAARQAGDLAGARAAANQARGWARTAGTRAEFMVAAARAALDMGDMAAGRDALRAAISLGAAGPAAREAAELLRVGTLTPDDHLSLARVYRAQGLHEESLEGFRRWLAARTGTPAQRAEVQLEYANALFYAERYDEVGAALRPIAGETNARFLHARAEAHRRNADEAVRIYLALAQQFPRSGTGAQALFLAAGARHDENDMDRARELYRRVVTTYPGSTQMGLAIMRLAGIAFIQQEYREAARLWDDYRNRYPRGTHALQATYWAGRARAELGDAAGAATLFRAVRERERDSYYALRASEHLGQPFWPLPMVAPPAENPAAARQVARWMEGIDLLRDAGFHDEASAEADRLAAAAGTDRATLYALAEALAERGYSQRAVRIGLRLQGSGPANRRLLRILYPFPYRTLITEEARSRDMDPFIASALIRQESMFEARVTSQAGARGLMQIMPATGRELAQGAGVGDWDAELLYHPEINVHLGTRYLARHLENYDGELASVFSAYNAGWHRVEWWHEFREHDETELFIERIPFRETRDYVKILLRNRALYSGLYGGD
jgi:soluble lytic murein transglycosylase